jgi:1,4-alpha-glucan branching enzyme
MEKIIRADVVDRVPPLNVKIQKKRFSLGIRPLGLLVSAASAAAIILFFILSHPVQNPGTSHRFVIYRPDVNSAEIAGTFTDWQRIPLNRLGSSGYWDITVNLPFGEHRFTYILDGKKRFADPTVPARELDDFGGRNSIISVESKT